MDLPGRRTLSARNRGIVVVTLILVVGLCVAWFAARPKHADAAPAAGPDPSIAGTAVRASDTDCGEGWNGGTSGLQQFAVWNATIYPVEVYLQDLATKKVYLDVENLGPGATRAQQVDLGPGRYEFVCLPSDADPVHGDPQEITGDQPADVTQGVVPITENALLPVVAHYEKWVKGQLPGLIAQVRTLAADAHAGDIAAGKRDWLTAHLHYETLGAAYGAFGDDDAAINAMPSPTVSPVVDKDLHGFHKVEALLWAGRTDGLAAEADALVKAVVHLRDDIAAGQVIQPIDVGLRTHEILEDALGHVLTGMDDGGSHTGLATVDANIDGTRQAMAPLLGLLRTRDPDLAATRTGLDRLQRLVRGYDHDGTWTPLGRLDRTQRERLDAALSEETELLSRIAVITDPRRGAQ